MNPTKPAAGPPPAAILTVYNIGEAPSMLTQTGGYVCTDTNRKRM